jgi:hypothetical protein
MLAALSHFNGVGHPGDAAYSIEELVKLYSRKDAAPLMSRSKSNAAPGTPSNPVGLLGF